MSITVFGDYFTPMPMWQEILYHVCMAVTVVYVCRNLYLAVCAPWRPKDPQEIRPSRSRITGKYLSQAAIACLLCGALLFLTSFV